MDLLKGFRVEVQNQSSGLWTSGTELVLRFCVYCVFADCTDIVFHDIGALVLNFALPLLRCSEVLITPSQCPCCFGSCITLLGSISKKKCISML